MALRQLGKHLPRVAHCGDRHSAASPLAQSCSGRCSSSSAPDKPSEDAKMDKVSADEWVEVIHQESGKPYFWNQRTGAGASCKRGCRGPRPASAP